ncbi:hypothetical protein [Luteimicrobium album]|uniref:hypothetical protein n=1 Tax=Luteimicrobium album TaxID=1054550 RepID=UPI0024E1881D|nr:hypothetical protein [Luteimicrobium album]
MFGTFRENPARPKQPGGGAGYAVTDVDGTHAAALAAGGASLRPPEDQDYGGRSAAVTDPEGSIGSFCSSRPERVPGERNDCNGLCRCDM